MWVTTATDSGARTGAQLLYLSIDLGDQLSLEIYQQNVAALLTLSRYVGHRVAPALGPEVPTGVRIVRTSLASPWVSVLTDLARTSAPVGYGVAVLYGLHRVLQMVMTWQRHRREMAERDAKLETEWLSAMLLFVSHGRHPEVQQTSLQVELNKQFVEEDSATVSQLREFEAVRAEDDRRRSDEAIQAIYDLGEVQAAEMIDQDDPRVMGQE